MTDKKLLELLVVIDNHYGRIRSKDERKADTQIYIRAFGTIPDEIVEKALYTAFTQCRFQNQLIVDWCAEIKSCCQPSSPRQMTFGRRLRQLPGKSRQICTTRPTAVSLPLTGAS